MLLDPRFANLDYFAEVVYHRLALALRAHNITSIASSPAVLRAALFPLNVDNTGACCGNAGVDIIGALEDNISGAIKILIGRGALSVSNSGDSISIDTDGAPGKSFSGFSDGIYIYNNTLGSNHTLEGGLGETELATFEAISAPAPIVSTKRRGRPPSPDGPKPRTKPSEYTPEFEAFWSAYPRRVNKGGAWLMYRRLIGREDESRIIAAAEHAATYYADTDEQYVPHASTFLGPQQRWREFADAAPVKRALPVASRSAAPAETKTERNLAVFGRVAARLRGD